MLCQDHHPLPRSSSSAEIIIFCSLVAGIGAGGQLPSSTLTKPQGQFDSVTLSATAASLSSNVSVRTSRARMRAAIVACAPGYIHESRKATLAPDSYGMAEHARGRSAVVLPSAD